jgi:5'-phosphate synthase pdxT subunit
LSPKVGVLALQGDVREHMGVLHSIGVRVVEVRTKSELSQVQGLILPGGESTTIAKLARIFDLFDPMRDAIRSGLPVFGTCAGLILLADAISDGAQGQETLGGLDALVRRNAFGSQTDSFEIELRFRGIPDPQVAAAFIRAPIIESVGSGVEVLSQLADDRIVAIRQGNLLGISFHPEITGETRVHEFFVREIVGA